MQRKLLGIINVDFDATVQLLIIYSAFVKYLRKNGNTMKQWRTEGVGWGDQPPPPEIPKALQNRAKLNPIVKTVKSC